MVFWGRMIGGAAPSFFSLIQLPARTMSVILRRESSKPTDDHSDETVPTSKRRRKCQSITKRRGSLILLVAALIALLSLSSWQRRVVASPAAAIAISDHVKALTLEGNPLVDVVYVYGNKSCPKVYEEYNKLLLAISPEKRGFLRSPPSQTDTIDMDLMGLSVKLTRKYAQNLGKIYILTNFAEEVSPELRAIPDVKVVYLSDYVDGLYFSSFLAESLMHKVVNDKLYIAMNDDMVFTRQVDLRTFFFTPNGTPRTFYETDTRIESTTHLFKRIVLGPHNGGAQSPMRYTYNRLAALGNVDFLKKRPYPSHVPRPFRRVFVERVEHMFPELFESAKSTHFRCQQCLNVHVLSVLHSYEGGTLRKARDISRLAYVDSKSTWSAVTEAWNRTNTMTIQEVEPHMQSTVRDFLEAKLRE